MIATSAPLTPHFMSSAAYSPPPHLWFGGATEHDSFAKYDMTIARLRTPLVRHESPQRVSTPMPTYRTMAEMIVERRRIDKPASPSTGSRSMSSRAMGASSSGAHGPAVKAYHAQPVGGRAQLHDYNTPFKERFAHADAPAATRDGPSVREGRLIQRIDEREQRCFSPPRHHGTTRDPTPAAPPSEAPPPLFITLGKSEVLRDY